MTFFSQLTNPRNSAKVFAAAVAATYGVAPFLISSFYVGNRYFYELAWIAIIAAISMLIGFRVPLLDARFRPGARRLVIASTAFHATIWLSFFAFMVVTFATAKSIPLLEAFSGASANELSQARGDFLKGRSGAEASLLYISTVFVTTLLPYSLINLFIVRSRSRYFLALVFFAFSLSFLQKALFLNLALPLIYFGAQRLKVSGVKITVGLVTAVAILYVATALSSGSDGATESNESSGLAGFFAADHLPSGTLEMLVWRSLAVPIFTAADTLMVFEQELHGEPLLGATSSFVSALFMMDRVNIEKMVFAHQFGGWNDVGNANAVFIVDAYVNFGWFGVVVFSMFVGQSLRWYARSQDEAFKALWLIYCFGLFSASLIGLLLSNGFVLLFFFAVFMRLGVSSSVRTNEVGMRRVGQRT